MSILPRYTQEIHIAVDHNPDWTMLTQLEKLVAGIEYFGINVPAAAYRNGAVGR